MASRLAKAIGRHPTLLAMYVIVGLHAFLFQSFVRLHHCAGFDACGLSLAKGAVWSIVWPVYWLGYFVLF